MSAGLRSALRLSFVASETELSAPAASEILAQVRSRPLWDVASIFPAGSDFPRLHVEWREGHGFVIQCFEDDLSWGCFLAAGLPLASPAIEINLGGQALERWPPGLFVPEEPARRALEHFLNSGKQDAALHWVRSDAFPRETIWEGRAGREAWERANPATRRDV